MAGSKQSFELVWQDRQIAVAFEDNWLGSGACHIELRSSERLPLTETGYLSCFIRRDGNINEETVRIWVVNSLDLAAKEKHWQRYLEESRQLRLF